MIHSPFHSPSFNASTLSIHNHTILFRQVPGTKGWDGALIEAVRDESWGRRPPSNVDPPWRAPSHRSIARYDTGLIARHTELFTTCGKRPIAVQICHARSSNPATPGTASHYLLRIKLLLYARGHTAHGPALFLQQAGPQTTPAR